MSIIECGHSLQRNCWTHKCSGEGRWRDQKPARNLVFQQEIDRNWFGRASLAAADQQQREFPATSDGDQKIRLDWFGGESLNKNEPRFVLRVFDLKCGRITDHDRIHCVRQSDSGDESRRHFHYGDFFPKFRFSSDSRLDRWDLSGCLGGSKDEGQETNA
ncbi:MAG TPA: hypothetical protein VND65_00500, partial [Candidatus Binatia bacterium]|nr:hypothetical protein [Candidatus Binatia bacterium]